MSFRSAAGSVKRVRTQAFALGILLSFCTQRLWAADLLSVEIGLNGPQQSMPLGHSFVLTGSVGSATRAVHAVFVRTSFQPFGLGSAADCNTVRDRLGEPVEFAVSAQSTAKIKALSVPKHTPLMGVVEHPEHYWGGADAQNQDVLMASSWFRKDAKEEQYSVRVPGDSSFFRQGARYCMLLYKVSQPPFQSAALMSGFDELRLSLSQCRNAECVDSALKGFGDIGRQAEKQVDPEHQPTLRKLGALLMDTAGQFKAAAEYPFGSLIARWPSLFKVPAPKAPTAEPLSTGPKKNDKTAAHPELKEDRFLHASEEPLARFLLLMLERGKDIRLWQNEGGFSYATSDGKLKIGFLRLVDAQTIELRNDKKEAADARRLSVQWDSMLLPDSSLSVRDMLEFSLGKLRAQRGFVRVDESFGANSTAEELLDLEKSLEKLDTALMRSLLARSGSDSWPGSPALNGVEIYKELGAWLFQDLLADCKTWAGQVSFPSATGNKHPCAADKKQEPKDARWPGFADEGDSPLRRLIQRLDNKRSASKALADIKQGLETLRGAYNIETEVNVGQGISFSRQSFFSQHITPTVGVGFITRPDSPIPMAYLGAKVYLWPNSIDEPMWIVNSAAADLRRIPAFELGFGLEKRDLGASGRYMGLGAGSFPPVFLGLSLQLLPYTTLSGGLVLLEARRSTLSQEVTRLFPSTYISLGLDPNLIDFLVAQFSQARNSAKDVSVTIKASNEGGP